MRAAFVMAVVAAGPAFAGPGTLTTLPRGDVIMQEDVDRSRGGYALPVPGKGTMFVKQVKAPASRKACRVHKPSLIKRLEALPQSPVATTWVQVGVVQIPEELGGGLLCIGDGNGCYILVSNSPSD